MIEKQIIQFSFFLHIFFARPSEDFFFFVLYPINKYLITSVLFKLRLYFTEMKKNEQSLLI